MSNEKIKFFMIAEFADWSLSSEMSSFYLPSSLLRSAKRQNAKFLCNLLKSLTKPKISEFYFVFYFKDFFNKKNFPLMKSKFLFW